jgi:hypothetical protein
MKLEFKGKSNYKMASVDNEAVLWRNGTTHEA